VTSELIRFNSYEILGKNMALIATFMNNPTSPGRFYNLWKQKLFFLWCQAWFREHMDATFMQLAPPQAKRVNRLVITEYVKNAIVCVFIHLHKNDLEFFTKLFKSSDKAFVTPYTSKFPS
jgi:hypothetical protein